MIPKPIEVPKQILDSVTALMVAQDMMLKAMNELDAARVTVDGDLGRRMYVTVQKIGATHAYIETTFRQNGVSSLQGDQVKQAVSNIRTMKAVVEPSDFETQAFVPGETQPAPAALEEQVEAVFDTPAKTEPEPPTYEMIDEAA